MEEGFQQTTNGICVRVQAFYLADQSKPLESYFVWAYRINITNQSTVTVQLLRRTWHITDAHGQVQLVQGQGVVGEQPVLEPGESFEYTSGTPLQTATGFMRGTYHMIATHEREPFDVVIPAFSLDSPHQAHRVH